MPKLVKQELEDYPLDERSTRGTNLRGGQPKPSSAFLSQGRPLTVPDSGPGPGCYSPQHSASKGMLLALMRQSSRARPLEGQPPPLGPGHYRAPPQARVKGGYIASKQTILSMKHRTSPDSSRLGAGQRGEDVKPMHKHKSSPAFILPADKPPQRSRILEDQ